VTQNVDPTFFLCFLGWQIPNFIPGLERVVGTQLVTENPRKCPGPLRTTFMADPLTTVHNVCGLAYNLPLTTPHRYIHRQKNQCVLPSFFPVDAFTVVVFAPNGTPTYQSAGFTRSPTPWPRLTIQKQLHTRRGETRQNKREDKTQPQSQHHPNSQGTRELQHTPPVPPHVPCRAKHTHNPHPHHPVPPAWCH